MRNMLWALALIPGAVLAQAKLIVPLSKGDPPVPAAEVSRADAIKRDPMVLSTQYVRLDPNAINSNVISIEMEGGVYVFTGHRHEVDKFGSVGWTGTSAQGAELSLSRDAKGMLGGTFQGRIEGTPKTKLIFITGNGPYGVMAERSRNEPAWKHGKSPVNDPRPFDTTRFPEPTSAPTATPRPPVGSPGASR